MTLRRILKWTGIAALALVVIAVAAIAVLLFTTPGARWVLGIANQRDLPLSARAIEGALARRFMLLDAELEIGQVHATVDTIVVAWRPLALRKRLIAADEVAVIGARVRIGAGDTTAVQTPAEKSGEQAQQWAMDASRVRVRRSSVEISPEVRFDDVDVVASGGWNSYRAEVRANATLPRLGLVRSLVRVNGDTRAATADSLDAQLLGGVVHGDAFARWEDGVSWHARLHGDSIHPGRLTDTPNDFLGSVSFRASTSGVLHGDTTRVRAEIASLEGTLRERPLSAHGLVEIDGSRIEASDVRAQWGSASAIFSGHMGDVADVTLDASIPSLAELLPRSRGSASVRGRMTGTPSSIVIRIAASGRNVRVARFDVPTFDADVDATLAAEDYVPHGVQVRTLDASVADGRLHADGTASWKDGVQWDGHVDAQRVETSLLTPPKWKIRGPLTIRADSQGRARGREIAGHASIDSLHGTIRDLPVSGSGSVAMARGTAEVSNLRLAWGRTRLRVDGTAGEDALDLDFDVVAPNLAAFDSSWAGSVTARGRATGTRREPAVNATVSADSLRIGEYAVRALRGDVDADVSLARPADVDLVALEVSRGETAFDTVSVSVSGPRGAHRASLHAAAKDARATVVLQGEYADSTWNGWIDDLRVDHKNAGAWRLDHRAPLIASRSQVRVDSLSVSSGISRVVAQGSWRAREAARVDAQLIDLEMARLQRFLAPGVQVTGTANGTLTVLARDVDGVRAQLDAQAGPGEFAYGGMKLAYEGRITGTANPEGVHADADMSLRDGATAVATLAAEFGLDGFVIGRDSLGVQPVSGRVDVECSNIGTVMAVFAPTAGKASGKLSAHFEPKGTAADFRMVGTMKVDNARVDMRNGLRLRDIALDVVSSEDGTLAVDGRVTSGGGRVVLGARSTPSQDGAIDAVVTAKGQRFQAVNQPEAQVFISPDVEVRIAQRRATITGDVAVPFARIETTQVPASAAAPSNDVVFVGDTLATQPKFEVRTQVRVTLGDSVNFSGFGLEARLGGGLLVSDESGRPTQGTGEIQILAGRYRAFGSELKIDSGRLIFGGGAIDNPGLDIRATRGLTTKSEMASSGEYVGMHLRGTLRKPEFSVYSNPPMSESEIMSYLVLGRPSATSGDDQSALASAAMLIGMQKGTSLAGEIGGKLSLDEAYLESGSDLKEASFVAGKYLSPKLYVSYATGLFEHTNTFRARYSLGKRWTLQSENGEANSADLLYWFERGK